VIGSSGGWTARAIASTAASTTGEIGSTGGSTALRTGPRPTVVTDWPVGWTARATAWIADSTVGAIASIGDWIAAATASSGGTIVTSAATAATRPSKRDGGVDRLDVLQDRQLAVSRLQQRELVPAQRAAVVAVQVVDPAEVVRRGLLVVGAVEGSLGLAVAVLLAEREPEVVERNPIIGLEQQSGLEALLGGLRVSAQQLRDAVVVKDARVSRLELEGVLEQRERLVVAPGALVGDRQRRQDGGGVG
jgi:hypothetical protein